MKTCYRIALAILLASCLATPSGSAQTLKESIEGIFGEVLDVNLAGPEPTATTSCPATCRPPRP